MDVLTNLNANPCKMCMPMGSVSAFYGIRGCMSLLHGSQGCSTYIRRHMATHYNEPVDIASSSLTEEGTVFGGEKNLVRGLENLIKLYNPEVIGIATTCLAETIGEDLPALVKRFYRSHPGVTAKLITVASAGYGGTQYEGFFYALRALAEQTEMDCRPNGRVNIITPLLSPADTRALKELLDQSGLVYNLLPDLAENLDGAYRPVYNRLPAGGTPLADIRLMGGARLTIEMSSLGGEELSPAFCLRERYGVPFLRFSLPVGLRGTDTFLEAVKQAGGSLPAKFLRDRGRYLDAMVDSHKYNSLVKAAVFGEPDFVYAAVRMLTENGALPVVAATGSKCALFRENILAELEKIKDFRLGEEGVVLEEADFTHIEMETRRLGANVLIGSSDARRMAEKLQLPLVRASFPIHDHVGGQRVRTLFYDGSLALLDCVTNAVLSGIERGFRGELFAAYFQPEKTPAAYPSRPERKFTGTEDRNATHPCFNGRGGKYARLHLPVAENCNIHCNYCLRKNSCLNESRPGVTAEIITPTEALAKYLFLKDKIANLSVVGVAGPGDALCDFAAVKETFTLIREKDKDVTFCLSTNGLLLPFYAEEIAALGVSHLTVTINTVSPVIGAKIYAHVDYRGKRYYGETGAALLLANQLAGLSIISGLGLASKVNIVLLPGVNDRHIEEIVRTVKELGCRFTNIMQVIPVAGSVFASLPLVSNKEITALRKTCESILPQMYHCRQCRADAVGCLDNDESFFYRRQICNNDGVRVTFAASSKNGMLVDQHFGQATDFYIYEYKEGRLRFKERRGIGGSAYCGSKSADKEEKMDKILGVVDGCDYVLTMRIGEAPRGKLEAKGVKIYTTYDRIEDAVQKILGGLDIEGNL